MRYADITDINIPERGPFPDTGGVDEIGSRAERRFRGGGGGRSRTGGGGRHGGHGGGRGAGGRGGRRAQRGDLRLAVLRLLRERPMHGYELMAEIAERSGGVWRPSAGSMYPTLSMLQDEGLLTAQEIEGGRRTFTLTAAGRKTAPAVTAPVPWAAMVESADPSVTELRAALRAAQVAVEQVGDAGSDADRHAAKTLLDELRRALYLLLAD